MSVSFKVLEEIQIEERCKDRKGWYLCFSSKQSQRFICNRIQRAADAPLTDTNLIRIQLIAPQKKTTRFEEHLLSLIEEQGSALSSYQISSDYIIGKKGKRKQSQKKEIKSEPSKTVVRKKQEPVLHVGNVNAEYTENSEESDESNEMETTKTAHGIRNADKVWVRYRMENSAIQLLGFAGVKEYGVCLYLTILVSLSQSHSGLLLLNQIRKYAIENENQYLVCRSLPSTVYYYKNLGWKLNRPNGPGIDFNQSLSDGVFMHFPLLYPICVIEEYLNSDVCSLVLAYCEKTLPEYIENAQHFQNIYSVWDVRQILPCFSWNEIAPLFYTQDVFVSFRVAKYKNCKSIAHLVPCENLENDQAHFRKDHEKKKSISPDYVLFLLTCSHLPAQGYPLLEHRICYLYEDECESIRDLLKKKFVSFFNNTGNLYGWSKNYR